MTALLLLMAACGGGRDSAQPGTETSQSAAQPNIVVHNNNAAVTTSGSFERATAYLGLSAQVLRGRGQASATFSVEAPRTGHYEAYLWWPQAVPDAGTVRVEVEHAGGRSQLQLDQRSQGGQWVSLGLFAFTRGAQARVTLHGAGATLLVDALRLHYVGEQRPALKWDTGQLPLGLVRNEYAVQLRATGGTPPYRFTLRDGSLPAGLTLDEGGSISGQPARAGSSRFTVTVADGTGAVLPLEMSIGIEDSHGDASASPAPAAAVNSREQAKAVSEADTLGQAGDLSGLLAQVAAMPENSWRRVNLNAYSDAWTPADLRPLWEGSNPPPWKIISAWSSYAWDAKRGNIVLYGGGHANYRGNDVYIWRGATQKWMRGSLPTEMLQDSMGFWVSEGGVGNAPASTHTYDNTMYFPGIDRVVVLGGAVDPTGGHFATSLGAPEGKFRYTGIYFFDPSRAHPDKVGGADNTHVKRVLGPGSTMPGGYMWSNRESYLNAQAGAAPPTESFVNSCGSVTTENGRDVAYIRTAHRVWRYSVADLNDPRGDRWELVGRYYLGGSGSQTTCGFDPQRKLLVATATNAKQFTYWDLSKPGTLANDVAFTVNDPEFNALLASSTFRLDYCGLKHDPVRNHFVLWCGDGRIWTLTPPATLSASGWTLLKRPAPTGDAPTEAVGRGILGKWKYIPNLDAFMGLIDPVQGNVWIYKPVGWRSPKPVNPANTPPSVALSQPVSGASFPAGSAIALTASAADSDGQVAQVEFYADGAKVGQATSAPWSVNWSGAAAGSHVVTAVATDNGGGVTTSAPVAINVLAPTASATVVLQRGTAGGPVADTFLSRYHPSLPLGTDIKLLDEGSNYTPLLRFSIFQSEGGPIPDGARVRSAVLSLYKYSVYEVTYSLHRMQQGWTEAGATWLQRQPGIPWASPGANGMGVDYQAMADATASVGYNPGWVNFDVTSAVTAMGGQLPQPNPGWRLRAVGGNTKGLKRLYPSDFTTNAALRPKLVITYE